MNRDMDQQKSYPKDYVNICTLFYILYEQKKIIKIKKYHIDSDIYM